jgi:hypothetical protein
MPPHKFDYTLKTILGSFALAFFLSWSSGAAAQYSNIQDLFLRLPNSETNNLSITERQDLIDRHGLANGYTAPSKEGYWVEIKSNNVLTLLGIHRSPTVYKLFAGGPGLPDLLVICRSRQTSGPSTSDQKYPGEAPMDLVLFQTGRNLDFIKAQIHDFIPPVGPLDFVRADTLKDARAQRDLEIIAQTFTGCLTCHASTEDRVALDIVTVTSINAHSCSHFLAQFKLLPMAWNGEYFVKPYDRAASPDEPWLRHMTPPRGIYYNPPGS